MKRTGEWPRVLEIDYSAARAQAIKWLGDRYLVARPINRNRYAAWKEPPPALRAMSIEGLRSILAPASH